MSNTKRVLIFNPYKLFEPYGVVESLMYRVLTHRGVEARYVVCDGVMTECAIARPGMGHVRRENTCDNCQHLIAERAERFGHPVEKIGSYLELEERLLAERWAASLTRDELPTAKFGAWELGAWVRSSMHTHFRISYIDLMNPVFEATYRSYLASGLKVAFGIERLFEQFQPDVFLLFNGRLDATRIALELAKLRGIRVVAHEATYQYGQISLWVNAGCMSRLSYREAWEAWKTVPLTQEQLQAIDGYMAGRANGREVWHHFNQTSQGADEIYERLGLSSERPIWALFTSSDDELVDMDEWKSPFGSQLEWLLDTLAYAKRRPDIDLVIRVHPNVGGRSSLGRNETQLREFEILAARLPENVRIVMPDDPVDSYMLMEVATLGLSFQSTAGLEMACRGKQVVVASQCDYDQIEAVELVTNRATYTATLDSFLKLPLGFRSPEIRRQAYRFAYRLVFGHSLPFPLIGWPEKGKKNEISVQLTYTLGASAFEAGRHPEIDRFVRVLLEDEPVCLPPTSAQRFVSPKAEYDYFGLEAPFPEPLLAEARSNLVLWVIDPSQEGWPEALGHLCASFTQQDAVTLAIVQDPGRSAPAEVFEGTFVSVYQAISGAIEAPPDLMLFPEPLSLERLADFFGRAKVVLAEEGSLGAQLATLAGRSVAAPARADAQSLLGELSEA